MMELVVAILNDTELTEFPDNLKVKQLISTLNSCSEEEFSNFSKEFEAFSETLQDKNRANELFEFILTERNRRVKRIRKDNNLTPPLHNGGSTFSYPNSPEKQLGDKSQGSRWSVSREDRRKILEQMERYRDDQKRRKRDNWCRLTRIASEFDEFWGNVTDQAGLTKNDLIKMKIDEGIIEVKIELPSESKTPKNQLERTHNSNQIRPNSPSSNYFQIVDFDCIEGLLNSLIDHKYTSKSSLSKSLSSSANFVLNCANNIYKSELMFYTDLKEFDQPYFLYYEKDDDFSPLKHYQFHYDDLGNFSRNKSFKDRSRKFYQERAFRHRYISKKPYELFFDDFSFKRLREELENLDENCKEFHNWFSTSVIRRGSIFVSSGPLLRSFSLLLVLSRLVHTSTSQISNLIWSHRKYGPEWTLTEILKNSQGRPVVYFTMENSSKLSIEASKLGIKFIQ